MPSDKRARQRAGRDARMAELRRAQQRRRNIKRGAVVAVILGVALALILVTTLSGGGSSNNKVKTVASPPPATADLTARTAPATSADCDSPASALPSPTTTIAATKIAVATIAAPATVPFPNLDGSSPHYTKFSTAPPFCIDVSKTYTATLTTDLGVVKIELLPQYAPVTVNNFVFLAGYHYYNGVIFQRVIQGFMDQGGDPTGTGGGGPGYSFADELPANKGAYVAGSLAMANSGANTNGSQFFIVDSASGGAELAASYSVFGQVTSGLGVIQAINADGSAASSSTGTPKKVHKIISITIKAS